MTVLTASLKTLFGLLGCVMAVSLIYGFATDYFVSCFDPKARWMQAGLLDFCIDISLIAAWFFYKESRWSLRVVFIFLLFWLGSFTICGYILSELFKLTPDESSKDPLYFVLVRRQKSDAVGHTRQVSVGTTRIIYVLLGCSMVMALALAFVIDGSPFRAEVFTPCMVPLLTDFLIHIVVFSVWVAYKETTGIDAFIWILLIIFFGSIALCAYIVRESFYLSPKQPAFLILFNKSGKDMMLSDHLLMEHGNV